jgi:hypothetical protein
MHFPKELFIELLKYDVLNINKFKLLNKEINKMIKLYLTFLLSNDNYSTIHSSFFQNKVFLNNFLINYFIKYSSTSKEICELYTFIYHFATLRLKNNIFPKNILLFFTRSCYLYAKLSLEKNDFSIYEKKVKEMKLVMMYIHRFVGNFDNISKKVYNEVEICMKMNEVII